MRLPDLRLMFNGLYGTTCFFITPVSEAQVRATKAASERSFCKHPTHRIGLILHTPDMKTQVILVDGYASAQCSSYALEVILRELRDFAKNHDARYEWLDKCAYAHLSYCVYRYKEEMRTEYGWNYRSSANDNANDNNVEFGVAINREQFYNVRFDINFKYKLLRPFGAIQNKKMRVKITEPFVTNFLDANTAEPYLKKFISCNRIYTSSIRDAIWELLGYLEKDLKVYYGK